MAKRTFTVDTTVAGLNLREGPSFNSAVISVLPNGSKVVVDGETEAPDGWVAVRGGGFVVKKYLK